MATLHSFQFIDLLDLQKSVDSVDQRIDTNMVVTLDQVERDLIPTTSRPRYIPNS